MCVSKTPLTVNSVPDLYQPGMGDPHKGIFPTTIVVGVTISIFSRRSSVVVTLRVYLYSRLLNPVSENSHTHVLYSGS